MVGEAVEARYQIRRYLHRHEERRWPVSAAERRSLSHLGGRAEKVSGHGTERCSSSHRAAPQVLGGGGGAGFGRAAEGDDYVPLGAVLLDLDIEARFAVHAE